MENESHGFILMSLDDPELQISKNPSNSELKIIPSNAQYQYLYQQLYGTNDTVTGQQQYQQQQHNDKHQIITNSSSPGGTSTPATLPPTILNDSPKRTPPTCTTMSPKSKNLITTTTPAATWKNDNENITNDYTLLKTSHEKNSNDESSWNEKVTNRDCHISRTRAIDENTSLLFRKQQQQQEPGTSNIAQPVNALTTLTSQLHHSTKSLPISPLDQKQQQQQHQKQQQQQQHHHRQGQKSPPHSATTSETLSKSTTFSSTAPNAILTQSKHSTLSPRSSATIIAASFKRQEEPAPAPPTTTKTAQSTKLMKPNRFNKSLLTRKSHDGSRTRKQELGHKDDSRWITAKRNRDFLMEDDDSDDNAWLKQQYQKQPRRRQQQSETKKTILAAAHARANITHEQTNLEESNNCNNKNTSNHPQQAPLASLAQHRITDDTASSTSTSTFITAKKRLLGFKRSAKAKTKRLKQRTLVFKN